ncbi:uncharacterized protein LOC117140038 [Drosophila mauritiana]|uniref:Uncharacterized protein LOC117140038 n=1 Tax=Drosophila mauritiana TaxID=7226 RepID=A0A6P8JQD0_DROMA|nr:uncharacterized protein LOC117140038 [Drosophila mauritiana]
MRYLGVIALVAFLAISAVMAHPPTSSSIEQGSGSGNRSTIRPVPRWPKWGGIGPVILNTPPTPWQ